MSLTPTLRSKREQYARLLEERARRLPLWTPHQGRQTEAYNSPADELFYGGAAGGGISGKTIAIIGGVVVAGGAGAAVALRGGGSSPAPASISSRKKSIAL